jgi:hypothetical protein
METGDSSQARWCSWPLHKPRMGSLESAEVLVRLAPTRSAPSVNQEKSLRWSLAYPDEAAHRIQWAYRFRRTATGGCELASPRIGPSHVSDRATRSVQLPDGTPRKGSRIVGLSVPTGVRTRASTVKVKSQFTNRLSIPAHRCLRDPSGVLQRACS